MGRSGRENGVEKEENGAKQDQTGQDAGTAVSHKFYYAFLAVLLIPAAGVPLAPNLNGLWVLILLVDTAVFFFNLARLHAKRVGPHEYTDRYLAYAASGILAFITICWGAYMGIAIYQSGSLGL